MARQIVAHYQEASMTVLEERVRKLESTVAALADALRVLTRALEGGPLAEPGDHGVAEAARTARDLLLSARLAPQPPAAAPPAAGPAEGGGPGGGATGRPS